MRRVSIMGASGSGKTTLGRRLAEVLGVPFLELDAVFHQPGWTELPTEEFRARTAAFVAGDGWVVDGNYAAVRDIVWDAADTVVFLDLPHGRVTRQLVGRTARRVVTRQELWNGNRESIRDALSRDPHRNVVRWSWITHTTHPERFDQARADPAYAHVRFVRLRGRSDVDALLDCLRREG